MSPSDHRAIEPDTYPADRVDRAQWLTWKATDDRKIPRAPYAHPDHPDRFVDAQDTAVWTDFDTAQEWASKLPGFGLAFVIRNRDDFPDEDLVLIDYDDTRDPETGAIHPLVREHLEWADSYADISTSGTGVHILCRGALPDGVQSITDELPAADGFPAPEIEVYDSARFVAMTGQHLQGTPTATTPCHAFLEDLVAEYATVTASQPAELRDEPRTPKADLADIDTTTDIQDVYDAIAHTRPADIRLRSTVTEERSDGSTSLDPCWTHSKSGTRLAAVDDGWIYRDGMLKLDALQVVALEEGLITDEREYPSGEAFQEAVDALRDRGAHIPEYEPEPAAPDRGLSRDAPPSPGTAETTDDEAADPALAHEADLLRETVTEQRARINDLEAALDEREATIETQQARIKALKADRDELRAKLEQREQAGAGDTRPRREGLNPWSRVSRWLSGR